MVTVLYTISSHPAVYLLFGVEGRPRLRKPVESDSETMLCTELQHSSLTIDFEKGLHGLGGVFCNSIQRPSEVTLVYMNFACLGQRVLCTTVRAGGSSLYDNAGQSFEEPTSPIRLRVDLYGECCHSFRGIVMNLNARALIMVKAAIA